MNEHSPFLLHILNVKSFLFAELRLQLHKASDGFGYCLVHDSFKALHKFNFLFIN